MGGYRPGSGRPKGCKDTKPRKPRSDKGKPRKKRTNKTVAKKQQKPKTKPVKKCESEILNPNKSIPEDIKRDAENADMTPLEYMLSVMRDGSADDARRDRMAQAAAPFVHMRMADKGNKKKDRKERAEQAGKGRFAPSAPPIKLKSVK